MTDKVQKISEKVEKLHGNPYYMMAVKDVLEILDMQEEPVSEELNEAAIDYAESVDYRGFSNAPWNFVQDVFKAGAKWQKRKDQKK